MPIWRGCKPQPNLLSSNGGPLSCCGDAVLYSTLYYIYHFFGVSDTRFVFLWSKNFVKLVPSSPKWVYLHWLLVCPWYLSDSYSHYLISCQVLRVSDAVLWSALHGVSVLALAQAPLILFKDDCCQPCPCHGILASDMYCV